MSLDMNEYIEFYDKETKKLKLIDDKIISLIIDRKILNFKINHLLKEGRKIIENLEEEENDF